MSHTTNNKSTADPLTGKLPYRLTNDYLFRAVFQSRPKALEGLCRAVLRLRPEDTLTVTLQNPIELGTRIEDKEFILDLAVIINNVLYLNMEMQVYLEVFWKERSLSYVCRSFDHLNHGDSYGAVLPVVHVGFLNYSLFPEYPEFCATYELANTSNPKYSYLYSDKLRISVVDLTQIGLATEDDKKHDIDLWARVFKAATWEEIEVLAQNNEYLKETVSGVRQLTEDEKIRQQCQAREDFAYWERIRNNRMKELEDGWVQAKDELDQANETIDQQKDTIDQQKGTIDQQKDTIDQQQITIERQKDELDQTKDELDQAKGELDQTKVELDQAKGELDQTKVELDQTKEKYIRAMEKIAELEKNQK